MTVGLVNDKLVAFLQAAGFRLKPVAIPNAKGKVDLSGCDVFVCNFHEPLSDDALARIRAFAQAGGGLVVCSTPWALKEADLARAQEVLTRLLDGESQAAIAKSMGVCEGTVSRIRAKAIEGIRRSLADDRPRPR